MVNLIYLILCSLSFVNLIIKDLNSFFYDYMDLKTTNQIRGILVWMIFFRHCISYFPKNIKRNKISILIDKSFGQNIVSPFLFYSGYGINESFLKKGNKYIKSLPIKSFIIFIKSQIILLVYLFDNILLGNKISFKTYLKAIIFKNGLGNSYWFAFAIILLYIYSYLSFILIRNKKLNIIGIIFITIFCYFHIIIVYKFYHKVIYSVDTIICFILGFFYSLLKSNLDRIIMKNDQIYFGIMILLIVFYYKLYNINNKNIYNVSLKNCFFILILVLMTIKIKFNNPLLTLLNSHSYSIYLLQRLVMRHIHKKRYLKNHEFISFFLQFLLVIFMAIIFDKYTFFINSLFQTNEKRNKYLIKAKKPSKNPLINDESYLKK